MRGALVVIALVLLLLALPARGAADETVRPVRVINFPAVQRVQGEVTVPAAIPHAALVSLKDLTVPPVEPTERGRLIDGGLVAAEGYTGVVLSLSGRAAGRALRAGEVGAYLIPDEESVTRAYEEDGLLQFPLEIRAALAQGTDRMHASQQSRQTLGFPRYRVRLFNTTDKTVNVNLFAYLTQ
jgi:hypothetical protein